MSNETRRNKAEAVATESERAALQWANGRTEYKGPAGRFVPLVGWHVEIGKCPPLDDLIRSGSNTPSITIRHQRQGEAPALVEHWYFGEAVRVYPLTYGPLATDVGGAARIADRMADEAGIVATWVDRSYVGCLVLLETDAGICQEPLVLSAKSTMTDRLYDALLAHLQVCEAADAVAGQTVPCAWIALPLAAGEEFAAGRDATTNIVPMRADYPTTGGKDIDAAYLKAISLPREMRQWANGMVEDALRWARETLDKQREGDGRTVAQRAVVKY